MLKSLLKLVALFMVNAITSERVGPDYLLSPENRSSLFQASRNLQLACCWLPSTLEDMDPGFTLGVLDTELGKPEKLARLSDDDREVAAEARKWLEIAMNDKNWRLMRPNISIPVHLGRLPLPVLMAASLSTGSENDLILTTAEVPLALREAAATISDPDSITGSLIKAAQAAKDRRSRMRVASKTSKPKKKGNKTHSEQTAFTDTKSCSAAKSLRRSEASATFERHLDTEGLEALEQPPASSPKKQENLKQSLEAEPHSRIIVPPELRAMEVSFKSVSSKLDWVVEETLRNKDDYFLVFSKDAIMLGQLTEVSATLNLDRRDNSNIGRSALTWLASPGPCNRFERDRKSK